MNEQSVQAALNIRRRNFEQYWNVIRHVAHQIWINTATYRREQEENVKVIEQAHLEAERKRGKK